MATIRRNTQRRGYTLTELLVATTSATVLFAGLASSVYVASQSLRFGEGDLIAEARNGRALDRVLADTREALRFAETTSTAITFDVPDRTGDGVADTIRYAWSGVQGEPLTYEFNGSTPAIVVEDVRQLSFDFATRQIDRGDDSEAADTATVYYQSHEYLRRQNATSIVIDTPSTVLENHLLIAAVAVDDAHGTTLAPSIPADWNELIAADHSNDITFGVWWRLASAAEAASHTFSWTGNEDAYGWIMHFTGHDVLNPINVWDSETGDKKKAGTPAVTTTVANCLVLRLGGFNEDDITSGDASMTDHRTITMRSSGGIDSDAASGGAAYAVQSIAGNTGVADFDLAARREYITLTIAIAPATN